MSFVKPERHGHGVPSPACGGGLGRGRVPQAPCPRAPSLTLPRKRGRESIAVPTPQVKIATLRQLLQAIDLT
jgi:hypothetical protein